MHVFINNSVPKRVEWLLFTLSISAKPADENKDPNSVETNLPSSVADCTPEFKQCMQETLQ